MVSSLVVYDHPVKYSYEIPNNAYQGPLKFLFWHMLQYFRLAFGKATSSHFFRVTVFKVSQELICRCSGAAAFFEELLFQNRHFFPAFFFSEQLLFHSETSIQKPNIENRKFFSAVTFRNSYPQKISTEELLFRSRFFCTAPTFSKKQSFRKSYFSEKRNSALPTFSGELHF